MDDREIGSHLSRLRRQADLGLRELARRAGLSPAALSAIEKGQSSPTLATLHKLLGALGTDFGRFFNDVPPTADGPVFSLAAQKTVADAHRKYRFLLPRRADIRFQMLHEKLSPMEREPQWEVHDCDLGGCLLSGGPLRIEIEGQGSWILKTGDAFYIKSGWRHRAVNAGKRPAMILTVLDPPRY